MAWRGGVLGVFIEEPVIYVVNTQVGLWASPYPRLTGRRYRNTFLWTRKYGLGPDYSRNRIPRLGAYGAGCGCSACQLSQVIISSSPHCSRVVNYHGPVVTGRDFRSRP